MIADHIRCLTIAITDGATPGNEGRGYVLRRILRRAVRIARQTLGVDGPMLCELVPAVVDTLGDAFPELKKNPQRVADVIKQEESAFLKTIDRGIEHFREAASGTPALRAGSRPTFEQKLVKSLGDEIDLQFAVELHSPDFVARNPYPAGEPSPDDLEQSRRNLPHIRLPEATYFVTWRCLPGIELAARERDEVMRTLTHWDGERCRVFGAVVMPDHVHWLVKPFPDHSLDDLLESVKRFSARQINQLRGESGSVWSPESFDHIVRDIRWLSKFLFYMSRNPVTGALVDKPSEYKWLFLHSSIVTHAGTSISSEIDTPGSESRGTISAADAFKLHDTYGFPIDLTQVMAEERGMTVDVAGFEKLMDEAREKSRAGVEHEDAITLTPNAIDTLQKINVDPTDDSAKFQGKPINARIMAIWDGSSFDDVASINRRVAIILDRTNHYAEQGGQVGDTGMLAIDYEAGLGVREGEGGDRFEIEQTQAVAAPGGSYVLHIGRVANGQFKIHDRVVADVDRGKRDPIQANHTATHLLNFALRQVIGEEVEQKGSLVADDRLRFDFSSNRAMKLDEIERVDRIVNDAIEQKMEIFTDTVPLAIAQKINGVRAVFGEKYPDPVRVVSIGAPIEHVVTELENPKWAEHSIEFCGGTHLANTEQAQHFAIVQEQALAAGVRRITAITGPAAIAAQKAGNDLLQRLENAASLEAEELVSEFDDIAAVADKLSIGAVMKHRVHEKLDALREQVKQVRKQEQASNREAVVEQARSIADADSATVIVKQIDGADKDTLLAAMDVIKAKCASSAIMLLSPDLEEGKVAIVAVVPKELIGKGLKAGDWVREAAKACGGGGGGRPDMAQAGGKQPEKVPDAIDAAQSFADSKLGG